MKIGCDIDDVLCDLVSEVIEFYNIKFKKNIKFEDFHTYAWYDIFNYSKEDFFPIIEDFLSNGAYLNVKPIDDMIQLIKDLSIENEIYLITARPQKYDEYTQKWLNKYLGNCYKELIYSNNSHSYENQNLTKAEICQNLGITVMFEDALNYAVSCAEVGIKTFLIDKPWNKNLNVDLNKNFIRVTNVNEIKEELFQIFNLNILQ